MLLLLASFAAAAPTYTCTTFPVRSTLAMGAFQAPADLASTKVNATALPPGWVPVGGSTGSGGAYVVACMSSEGEAAPAGNPALCGRFRDDGFPEIAGSTVQQCSASDGQDTLVLNVTSADACGRAESWAESVGWRRASATPDTRTWQRGALTLTTTCTATTVRLTIR